VVNVGFLDGLRANIGGGHEAATHKAVQDGDKDRINGLYPSLGFGRVEDMRRSALKGGLPDGMARLTGHIPET
jgi:hypothetical protein